MAAQIRVLSTEDDKPIRTFDVLRIPVARLRLHPLNPRGGHFDTTDLEASLAEHGLVEPIAVKRVVEHGQTYWQVHHGNRRATAARRLGWQTIDAYEVRDEGDEIIAMVLHNISEPLPPTRLALALQYARDTYGWSTERAARTYGLTPDKAALIASLLNPNIPNAVREALDHKRLTLSQYQHLPRRAPAHVIEAVLADATGDDGAVTVERIRQATRRARETGSAPSPQRVEDESGHESPVARVNTARRELAAVLAELPTLSPIDQARVTRALADVRDLLKD